VKCHLNPTASRVCHIYIYKTYLHQIT